MQRELIIIQWEINNNKEHLKWKSYYLSQISSCWRCALPTIYTKSPQEWPLVTLHKNLDVCVCDLIWSKSMPLYFPFYLPKESFFVSMGFSLSLWSQCPKAHTLLCHHHMTPKSHIQYNKVKLETLKCSQNPNESTIFVQHKLSFLLKWQNQTIQQNPKTKTGC